MASALEPGAGLQQFVQHVESLKSMDPSTMLSGFAREFLMLREQQTAFIQRAPLDEGRKPWNSRKNRYRDIIPYDNTRCVLPYEDELGEGSDYINANYIKTEDGETAVIAAQGPLPNTTSDFYRMIWQHSARIVVMACNVVEAGRFKCAKYWPDADEPDEFGDIRVELLREEDVNGFFVIRTLKLTKGESSRMVYNYHYQVWPDHGVPQSSKGVMKMLSHIREIQPDNSSPIVIHCSAGVGRTGTLCALDFTLQKLRKLGINCPPFNIFRTVTQLREQRIAMVQTQEQYVFVYKALLELVQNLLDSFSSNDEATANNDYYVIKDIRRQTTSMPAHRLRALTNLHLPSVDDEIKQSAMPEDVDADAFVDGQSSSEQENQDISNSDDGPTISPSGDITFPYRVVKPRGPRPPPTAWGAAA